MIIGKITNGTRKKQSWDDVSNNEIKICQNLHKWRTCIDVIL